MGSNGLSQLIIVSSDILIFLKIKDVNQAKSQFRKHIRTRKMTPVTFLKKASAHHIFLALSYKIFEIKTGFLTKR